MQKNSVLFFAVAAVAFAFIVAACPESEGGTDDKAAKEEAAKLENQPAAEELAALFDTAGGFPAALTNSWKVWGHRNSLITQGFGADPTAMVYKDRVYVFASNDSLMYDASGKPAIMTYAAGIQGLRAISSADLANWTDHGVINIHGPDSTNPLIDNPPIGGRGPDVDNPDSYQTDGSWAPSAVWKRIGGKDRFFIYYANGGNGIGVITADSPTGPWRAPLGERKLLVHRSTPNAGNVSNLFDPGAIVDDDGYAFLFFGGGSNSGELTGQGRRVQLGSNMISLVGTPELFDPPYLFEASDITKIGDMYYFSYVTNSAAGGKYGLQSTQIAYMTGYDPMGLFGDPKGILISPATQLNSDDNNNHHCIFQFKGEYYIAYHASKVKEAMGLRNFNGITGGRYRSSFIDKVTVTSGGVIEPVTMTRQGVEQVGTLNPFVRNEAETIAVMGGVYTRADPSASNGMVVTSIDTGNWLGVYGVDFGSAGAKQFQARVRMPSTANYVGAIELRLDPTAAGNPAADGNLNATNTARIEGGTVIGRVQFKAKEGKDGYATAKINLNQTVTGTHNLVFVFYSSLDPVEENVTTAPADPRHKNGFEFDRWQFFK
jgi:arabinoxylan arabinofuranohydrolase